MGLTDESTLVETLRAGRHVERRVLVEEVDGLERDFDLLARHDGEVLDAWDLNSICGLVYAQAGLI